MCEGVPFDLKKGKETVIQHTSFIFCETSFTYHLDEKEDFWDDFKVIKQDFLQVFQSSGIGKIEDK